MSFNDDVILSFRANGGVVKEPVDWGDSLVLVHVIRKDGSERVLPLRGVVTDDGWHVTATAAGAPKNPGWVYNLRRMDSTTIEVAGDGGAEPVPVTVTELTGAERDAIWARYLEIPPFPSYEEKSGGRVFPIFRFARA
ncbi:nitroreductase family deazaflavin-dependent oxidoreductase [Microbacterium halophytorum]|uniref:nitroreductase family deazaflavin-dependent oxidoreductase n=1 Tax=Microbacterium halophytorum TaxID=2067568 RepID=UPI001319D21E|nr:nitroreductase family deazaflavin-dependent oxidoreductase [Microbacterium halophytorum]